MITYKKIQSNGNNFLLLDNRTLSYNTEVLSKYALRDCDVKKGIGADGILVIEPSENANFKMRIINSNGYESEMCGNGARCIARYAYETDIAPATMTFETLAGIIEAKVFGNLVKIGMGHYALEDIEKINEIMVADKRVKYQFMAVGVPHVVVFQEDNAIYTREEMMLIGRTFDQNHILFTNGTNVNFVKDISQNQIEVITYERGVEDITDSCGTGSCASAVLASMRYSKTSPVDVLNIGGTNTVYFEKLKEYVEIFLEGHVFYSGNIQCESIELNCEVNR